MCSSPRAGEIKNSQPSADGNTKRKKQFLLAHGTLCVGEPFNRFKFISNFTMFHPRTRFVVNAAAAIACSIDAGRVELSDRSW
jgi:hypothetical protein